MTIEDKFLWNLLRFLAVHGERIKVGRHFYISSNKIGKHNTVLLSNGAYGKYTNGKFVKHKQLWSPPRGMHAELLLVVVLLKTANKRGAIPCIRVPR